MPADPNEEAVKAWKQARADQAYTRQRAQADNAKLIATFVAAIVATLVATGLQVGSPSWLDVLATLGLTIVVILTWCVIQNDRLQEVDEARVDQVLLNSAWAWDRKREELDQLTQALVYFNDDLLEWMISGARWQLAAAAATSILAAASLLFPAAVPIWPVLAPTLPR